MELRANFLRFQPSIQFEHRAKTTAEFGKDVEAAIRKVKKKMFAVLRVALLRDTKESRVPLSTFASVSIAVLYFLTFNKLRQFTGNHNQSFY